MEKLEKKEQLEIINEAYKKHRAVRWVRTFNYLTSISLIVLYSAARAGVTEETRLMLLMLTVVNLIMQLIMNVGLLKDLVSSRIQVNIIKAQEMPKDVEDLIKALTREVEYSDVEKK